MPINFDKAFGVHDNALLLFERRTQLLTANIANADTPGYKARDIDFDKVLQNAQSDQLTMRATNENHLPMSGNALNQHHKFRIPDQSSADRKSTRLNSSHRCISYAVFCLKKKKKKKKK